MGVCSGFTGIGTPEANQQDELTEPEALEAKAAAELPPWPESESPEPSEEPTPEELAAKEAVEVEGDEEHADVQLEDRGEDPAVSGVQEVGSVEHGA